jgi:hypothetical protein
MQVGRYCMIAAVSGSFMLAGCGSDTTAPASYVGTYVFVGYTEDTPLPDVPEAPFFSDMTITLDSLRDILVLREDLTYTETGDLWGTSFAGAPEHSSILANGTYSITNTAITLTPNASANVGGGSGTVKNDTLTFSRYPGSWILAKH